MRGNIKLTLHKYIPYADTQEETMFLNSLTYTLGYVDTSNNCGNLKNTIFLNGYSIDKRRKHSKSINTWSHVIVHETLHIVLSELIDIDTSRKLDVLEIVSEEKDVFWKNIWLNKD